MKKSILLFALILTYTLNNHAEETKSEDVKEEAVAETKTETAEAATETEAKPEVAQPASNDIMADCSNAFSEYVKSLPKAKQQAEFEAWWAYNDNQLPYYKSDEFKMKEERPKWQKLFEAMLTQSEVVYDIAPKVKLGQYDFKKKGFPVDIKIDAKEKFVMNHLTNTFSMGGLGGGTTDKAYCSTSHQDPKKDNPTEVVFKLQNLDQLKFISVPEDKAKLITASLSSDRLTEMVMKIKPIKANKVTLKMGTLKFTKMILEAKVKEASVRADSEKIEFKY